MESVRIHVAWAIAAALAAGVACAPKVQVEAPKEPIEIHLKIDHEIRVKVERDVEDLLEDEELFGGSQ